MVGAILVTLFRYCLGLSFWVCEIQAYWATYKAKKCWYKRKVYQSIINYGRYQSTSWNGWYKIIPKECLIKEYQDIGDINMMLISNISKFLFLSKDHWYQSISKDCWYQVISKEIKLHKKFF